MKLQGGNVCIQLSDFHVVDLIIVLKLGMNQSPIMYKQITEQDSNNQELGTRLAVLKEHLTPCSLQKDLSHVEHPN